MTASVLRLLDVTVSEMSPMRWKWAVSDGDVEIACGYETTRENAEIAGDSALFALLSIRR